MSNLSKVELRARRKKRIRKRVNGTPERPRLSVFRSSRHIYAQVIDDIAGKTLVSVGSFKKGGAEKNATIDACAELGKKLASLCLEKEIKAVVFDKNGYDYHGRVKAVAEGAREGGLKF